MDAMAMAERRQLRRKVGFWRIVALVFLVAIGFALYTTFASDTETARPHVAQIRISGMITDDRELLDRLDKIADDDAVKALVVSINSPGGTTYGGERIFKAIRHVSEKKPVVSDVRTLAASAGYMIASAGDHIVAGESSITGSIGVIFQYPQIDEVMKKIGVSMEEIKSAPLKAEPSPFHPASDDAKAMIRSMVMDSYAWFVDLVADRRKLPRDEVLKLADGTIYTGRQALKVKLVDELGGDRDIRAWLETRGVAKNLPLVEWKAKKEGSNFFLSSAISQVMRFAGLDPAFLPAASGPWGTDKLFLDGLVSVWQVGPR
ncbi:MAG: signal peptide peptidase SppA [Neorhizobium sp.]|nr:signal peptide peptidase SppA [Neorhizobium sp.]